MVIENLCKCGTTSSSKHGQQCNRCGGFRYTQAIPGRKDDKDKMHYSLLVEGMPRALSRVVEVLEHGAIKYEAHNWRKVDNGIERYKEAFYRHVMNIDGGLLSRDKDSQLLHLAHIACNALFLMELIGEE